MVLLLMRLLFSFIPQLESSLQQGFKQVFEWRFFDVGGTTSGKRSLSWASHSLRGGTVGIIRGGDDDCDWGSGSGSSRGAVASAPLPVLFIRA